VRARAWIGLDVAEHAAPGSRSAWTLLAVAAAMLVALSVAALRVEILRARYQLGELARVESTLLAERDALRVEVRALRHPDRLARLARERGFSPPERVIDLRPEARP
jgi:cell division protein FtsL